MLQDSLLAPRPQWLLPALDALRRHEVLTPNQLGVNATLEAAEIEAALPDLLREELVIEYPVHFRTEERALTLAPAGLVLLQRAGLAPPGRLPGLRRGLHRLAHDLERNELGLVLEALDARGVFRLERWVTSASRIAFAAHLPTRGGLGRIPLVADALAVLRVGSRLDAVLIEIDMGSVSLDRMRSKFAGYLAWWQSGGPLTRFGLRSVRVLTLAPTPARIERLRQAAEGLTNGGGLGLLWFGPLDAARTTNPNHLLGRHFLRADRPGERLSLLPDSAALPPA